MSYQTRTADLGWSIPSLGDTLWLTHNTNTVLLVAALDTTTAEFKRHSPHRPPSSSPVQRHEQGPWSSRSPLLARNATEPQLVRHCSCNWTSSLSDGAFSLEAPRLGVEPPEGCCCMRTRRRLGGQQLCSCTVPQEHATCLRLEGDRAREAIERDHSLHHCVYM